MFSRRSPPQPTPTRSDRVRQLWAQFEAWHAAETKRIEQQVTSELKDLDNKWQKTPSKKRGSKAEHEERKKTRRKEIQKTFTGNMVREEWQNRLDKAGLQSDDWTNMTEVEQRSVERILGADLDLEAMELPVVQSTPSPPSGSLFAPPMTSDSRTASAVSDNYAVVKPNYEPWMQVVSHTINFCGVNAYMVIDVINRSTNLEATMKLVSTPLQLHRGALAVEMALPTCLGLRKLLGLQLKLPRLVLPNTPQNILPPK